jgi:hypothetical protein
MRLCVLKVHDDTSATAVARAHQQRVRKVAANAATKLRLSSLTWAVHAWSDYARQQAERKRLTTLAMGHMGNREEARGFMAWVEDWDEQVRIRGIITDAHVRLHARESLAAFQEWQAAYPPYPPPPPITLEDLPAPPALPPPLAPPPDLGLDLGELPRYSAPPSEATTEAAPAPAPASALARALPSAAPAPAAAATSACAPPPAVLHAGEGGMTSLCEALRACVANGAIGIGAHSNEASAESGGGAAESATAADEPPARSSREPPAEPPTAAPTAASSDLYGDPMAT